MSSDEEENKILDLRNMEDVFACLEAVAMAQAVLSSIDPDTAAELEKVTEALGALSLVIDQGDLVQVIQKTVEVPGAGEQVSPSQPAPPLASGKQGIDDLVAFASGGKSKESSTRSSGAEDGIVDILTGEKIR